MTIQRIVTAAVVAGLATGCARGVDVTSTRPQYTFPATCADAVTVFDSRARVPSDYYELAYIRAEGNAVWTDNEDIVFRMKQRAAEMGATAIIANVSGPSATAAQILGAAVGTGDAERQGSALAIHQPSERARVQNQCASNPSR